MYGKIEIPRATKTMSRYVNMYGNDWDDYVDNAIKVQRANPRCFT
jgi:hypothetical protein